MFDLTEIPSGVPVGLLFRTRELDSIMSLSINLFNMMGVQLRTAQGIHESFIGSGSEYVIPELEPMWIMLVNGTFMYRGY